MSPAALLGDRVLSCMLYSMVECRAWGSRTHVPHQKALKKSLGIKDQSCPMLRLGRRVVPVFVPVFVPNFVPMFPPGFVPRFAQEQQPRG